MVTAKKVTPWKERHVFVRHGDRMGLGCGACNAFATDRVRTWLKLAYSGGHEKPQAQVNITNQAGVVCDNATRARLIKRREGIEVTRPAKITLPEPLGV